MLIGIEEVDTGGLLGGSGVLVMMVVVMLNLARATYGVPSITTRTNVLQTLEAFV